MQSVLADWLLDGRDKASERRGVSTGHLLHRQPRRFGHHLRRVAILLAAEAAREKATHTNEVVVIEADYDPVEGRMART